VYEVAELLELGELSEFLQISHPMKYLHLLKAFEKWLELLSDNRNCR
jgi:hypothetical protein